MITEINVNSIFPHPNNPRKDLGDITELSDSIKASGVLQNLTVVPRRDEAGNIIENEYTAIIGHRRLAAAKQAGLETVPCSIRDMDDNEQLATMLSENMQRSDLTPYEQAQGFQMMMDFGETFDTISERTGFSKTTIRHRIKLLELDKDELEEAELRGGNLTDYVELEKIKDIERKNKVLKSIGTPNFNYQLRSALSEEQGEIKIKEFAAKLNEVAQQIDEDAVKDKKFVKTDWFSIYSSQEFEMPENISETPHYFVIGKFGIDVYRDKTEEEIENGQKREERQRQEQEKLELRRQQADELRTRAYELRKSFIKELNPTNKNIYGIEKIAAYALFKNYWREIDTEQLCEILKIDAQVYDDTYSPDEALDIALEHSPDIRRVLLAASYSSLADGEEVGYINYSCEYNENADLDNIYDFLKQLGYEMSDEEIMLQDGTHPFFDEEMEDEQEDIAEILEPEADSAEYETEGYEEDFEI